MGTRSLLTLLIVSVILVVVFKFTLTHYPLESNMPSLWDVLTKSKEERMRDRMKESPPTAPKELPKVASPSNPSVSMGNTLDAVKRRNKLLKDI